MSLARDPGRQRSGPFLFKADHVYGFYPTKIGICRAHRREIAPAVAASTSRLFASSRACGVFAAALVCWEAIRRAQDQFENLFNENTTTFSWTDLESCGSDRPATAPWRAAAAGPNLHHFWREIPPGSEDLPGRFTLRRIHGICGHGSKAKSLAPSEHPNPTTKVDPKMGGAPTPKWDTIGFDPKPCHKHLQTPSLKQV